MKVAFHTLGCRVNVYESEAMVEKFKNEGYGVVGFNEAADVYVINTCTVTNMGDKKSRQAISKARKQNPSSVIAVVGCYSQVSPDEVSKVEGVDIVLGNRNKGDIIYYVNKFMFEKTQIIQVNDVLRDKKFEPLEIEEYDDKTRAFLKIQDGCNRFCSFCLIPYARGSVCSKDHETVIKEVKKLAENGFKEIILSGIHIASYGSEFDKVYTLVDLLEELDKVEGIERIRIGSIDPGFFSNDTVSRMAGIKKLCPHFHLSLQSGCDETLKRMNRRYTSGEYADILKDLRKKIKNVSITTDIIVGFPGETEEEFNRTVDFLSDIKLTKMHIFKYSPRKGTKAAGMKDDVNGTEKDRRSKVLLKLDEQNEKDFAKSFIGKSLEVLVEEDCTDKEGYYSGYTENYIKVIFKGKNVSLGDIVKVTIESYKDGVLVGK